MKRYYVYRDGYRYEFEFYSLWAAFAMCREIKGDCVVDAETGEVLAERGQSPLFFLLAPGTCARPGISVNRQFQQIFIQIFVQNVNRQNPIIVVY